MTKQLSNATTYADERQNVPDVMSPILSFTPDDGLMLVIRGMVSAGSERGFPIYMDLRDTNGDPLPEDTRLAFKYKAPGMDDAQTVTHPLDHIRPWNALTLEEQQDAEYIDQVKTILKNTDTALQQGEIPDLNVRDIDELRVSVKSSAQVDWDNSRFYIDRNAVREV
ncbi:hypothetical protein SAMN05216388_1001233 [Halorientalis persicus]|uniref:Uncharacterized protein n=1 Tax=Halorientalis persicus TaxID=1367881 RepID=A0A1H8DAY9_9EURY|nr:hypothetical protein [Halorientalis persicus]SEN04440.1 hypothetical protein SAMN05216388_1001233 [Halorientalis persicus]